jgi:hypothetical protein
MLVVSQFVPDFLLNLTQVVIFRYYGFLASIVVRVAMYLAWHIAYGNFICSSSGLASAEEGKAQV